MGDLALLPVFRPLAGPPGVFFLQEWAGSPRSSPNASLFRPLSPSLAYHQLSNSDAELGVGKAALLLLKLICIGVLI